MMSRITLFDPYGKKFTNNMIEWWEIQGYEVKYDRYYDPVLADWGEIIFFFTCDNNLKSAMNPDQALRDEWLVERRKEIPWDLHEFDLANKKIVVMPIDIEVYGGSHADALLWDVVDHCIFIAPHIRDMALEDSRLQGHKMRIHTIPFSINPEKWTFKERKPGFNIAVVAEIWESKGIDYVLQIAYKLKQIDEKYKIHYLGKEADYHWHRYYRSQFIKDNNLNIEFIDWVDNLNDWLDDKDYLLHCSIKEAFSAATAEAAAKGIRPILHAFGGYEPLWGDSGWVWQGIDEAVDMLTDGEYDSESYRQYLFDKGFTTDQMMTKIMEAISE